MDDYHYNGMENFDGGLDSWDHDDDGKLNVLEENERRMFDDILAGDEDDGDDYLLLDDDTDL